MELYYEVFNSENLAKQPGIILYKHYATSQLCHGLTRMVRTAESNIEATRDAVDSYLCADGRPYTGNGHDVYEQFRSRDYRLYLTVCPPYKVNVASNKTTWSHTHQPHDGDYNDEKPRQSGAKQLQGIRMQPAAALPHKQQGTGLERFANGILGVEILQHPHRCKQCQRCMYHRRSALPHRGGHARLC